MPETNTPKPKAIFRADAGSKIGGGHLVRCYALASELAQNGWEVHLATHKASFETVPFLEEKRFSTIPMDGPLELEIETISRLGGRGDVFILDHYERNRSYERECRRLCKFLVAFDDLPNRKHDCDLLLDPTLGRSSEEYSKLVPPDATILCGPRYALLRNQFSEATKPQPRTELKKLLLMLGAADPHGLTEKILVTLNQLPYSLEIDVVGSSVSSSALPTNPKLKVNLYHQVEDVRTLMERADLAIGASGSASWERCSVGLPSILYIIADNQKDICKALDKAGAAINLGWFHSDSPQQLLDVLNSLWSEPARLTAMGRRAFDVCDGQGARRVREYLAEGL